MSGVRAPEEPYARIQFVRSRTARKFSIGFKGTKETNCYTQDVRYRGIGTLVPAESDLLTGIPQERLLKYLDVYVSLRVRGIDVKVMKLDHPNVRT